MVKANENVSTNVILPHGNGIAGIFHLSESADNIEADHNIFKR